MAVRLKKLSTATLVVNLPHCRAAKLHVYDNTSMFLVQSNPHSIQGYCICALITTPSLISAMWWWYQTGIQNHWIMKRCNNGLCWAHGRRCWLVFVVMNHTCFVVHTIDCFIHANKLPVILVVTLWKLHRALALPSLLSSLDSPWICVNVRSQYGQFHSSNMIWNLAKLKQRSREYLLLALYPHLHLLV